MMYYKSIKDMLDSGNIASEAWGLLGNEDNFVEYVEFEAFYEEHPGENYYLDKDKEEKFLKAREELLPLWNNRFKLSFLNGNAQYSDWLQDLLERAMSE